jgi:hypothetical protein
MRNVASRLPSKPDDKDSDYWDMAATKLKLTHLSIYVRMSSSVKCKVLKMVDFNISINFRKKK